MGNYIFLIKVLTRSPNCDIMYMWGKGDNNFILDCIKNFLNRKYKKGIDNYTEMCYNIYVRLGVNQNPTVYKEDKKNMAKVNKISDGALKALEALKAVGTATAKDLKDGGLDKLNSAHLTALVNRGLVEATDTVVEVLTVVKRKVKAYTITEKGKTFDNKEGE